MSKKVKPAVFANCVCQLIILIVGIMICRQQKDVARVSAQDKTVATELASDWTTKPFTTIRVTDNKCEVGEESVFTREWAGTVEGCQYSYRDNYSWSWDAEPKVGTRQEYDDYISYKHRVSDDSYSTLRWRYPCTVIRPEPSIKQDELWDMRFCGKRSSQSFATSQRPVKSGNTWACPSGTVACSAETSPDNTLCVKQEKKATDCPITFMKFVAASDLAQYKNNAAYTVQKVDDLDSFVTSTTKGDSLPMTSVRLEEKPCLDQRETSSNPNKKYYPLEGDRFVDNCSIQAAYGTAYDDRYTELGKETTEFDVQDESKVIRTLESMPLFRNYVNVNERNSYKYKLWGRPTIAWDLQCESKHPRATVIKAIKNDEDDVALNPGTARALVITALVGGGILSCAFTSCAIAGNNPAKKGIGKICAFVLTAIQAGLFLGAYFIIAGQESELQERLVSTKEVQMLNGCGDKFTNVPEHFVTDIEAAQQEISTTAVYAMIGTVCALLAGFSCCLCNGTKALKNLDHFMDASSSDSD